jgi:hypothetical protein
MGTLLKGPAGTLDVPPEQVDRYLAQGYTPVGVQERAAQVTDAALAARGEERGALGTVNAALASGLSGLTAGASDVALGAVLGADQKERLAAEKAANPGVSAAANIAGAIAPTLITGGTSAAASAARLTPTAAISRIGAAAAKTAETASTAAKIGRAALGGALESGVQALGEAAGELALSNDPLTAEKISSLLSSKLLFSGAVGGVAGSLGKVAEIGLTKAKGALDDFAAKAATRAETSAAGAIPEDLANLDLAGLRKARQAEEESFKASTKTELEAIEATRVTQRKDLADELATFRKEIKEQKVWLSIANSEEAEIRTIAKQSLKADRQLDNVLDNPKYLASNPKTALSALQKQEHTFEQILARADDLKVKFAGDESGTRLAALEQVAPALERNRALQQRIADLTSAPTSQQLTELATASKGRLDAIEAAKEALTSAPKKSFLENMAGGAVFGGVTSAVSAIPGIGPLAAPFVGAKVSEFVGEKVFGRLAKAAGEAAGRTSKAIGTFLDLSSRTGVSTGPIAPVLATKVLAHVQFAPHSDLDEPFEVPKGPHREQLAPLFHQRAAEIRSQTMPGPDGKPTMRPEARSAMAAQLAPIAAVNPMLADQLETLADRRVSFLADKLPRRPDVGGIPIGPDIWKPSDMQMRQWARYVAAVEDPGGIEERLADGTITPEDAEVMREVYPERMAEITMQIVKELPTLRKQLPYQKRIALSVFSNVPVDAAMDHRVLSVLQEGFKAEPGTSGGVTPPKASPQFGSVRAEKATPSQERAG